MKCSVSVLVASLIVIGPFGGAAFAQQSFTLLPHMPGNDRTISTGISGDGLTVIGGSQKGTSLYAASSAFRWTAAGGIKLLPLPSGGKTAIANAVSDDGSVIACRFSMSAGPITIPEAFRWSSAAGTQVLPTFPNSAWPQREAFAVSGNGRFTVGYALSGSAGAFRSVYWDGVSAPVGFLTSLNPGPANAVSDDGLIIAGDADNGLFRWNANDGYRGIVPTNGWSQFDLDGMSDDGEVIAGHGLLGERRRAFRWTLDTGAAALPLVAGWERSRASGISGDGSVIVGELLPDTDIPGQAFYWSKATGTVYLRSLLYPSVPDDWTLIRATGVSDDGLTVAGVATRDGEYRAFVATIPAPGMGITVLAGCIIHPSRRRRVEEATE